jgi:WS/DGAT/MGAT family acyltransferase
MSRVDHAWLRMDEPANLMMINGILLFDEPLLLSEFKEVAEKRFVTILRFRQRVIPGRWGGRHCWEEEPNFDIDAHVLEETLVSPGGDAELQEVVSRWMSTPLDRSRPLWQAHVIHGYGEGSAVLWRLHHCLGDGVALMLALLSMTDLSAGGSPASPEASTPPGEDNPLRSLFGPQPPSPEEAQRYLERVMPEAVKLLTGPAEALRRLSRWKKGAAFVPTFGRLAARWPDPRTVFKGPLAIEKRAAWSDSIPLGEIDELRRRLGGTVNDVLTTAVAGGLRRYLLAHGSVSRRRRFRAVVPVSLRPLEEMATLGNQFGLVFLALPVGIEDPRERLAELQRRMNGLKHSYEPAVVLQVLAALGSAPRLVQDLVVRIFGKKGTAVLTNVPGPRETLYFAGKPIRSFIFWVPQSGRLGMGISIASYAGQVRVGVATDAGLVPDPESVVRGFQEELVSMCRCAEESAS